MRPAAGADEFVSDPVGRYVTGASFVYFCAHPRLCGFLLWGRPDADDVHRLIRLLKSELAPPSVPHVSLVDTRGLDGVDARAYAALAGYVREHWQPLARYVTKLALVRPNGLAGAVVSGFFHVMSPPYPVATFSEPGAALDWLGCVDDRKLLAELDDLQAAASGTSPVVAQLRALLEANLTSVTLEGAARTLGLSERTLQRRLREAGTTFHKELTFTQLRVAKAHLLDTNAPLSTIAIEVGCASVHHFSALFSKATGESPSAWRARHRAREGEGR